MKKFAILGMSFVLVLGLSYPIWAQAAAGYLRQKQGDSAEDALIASFRDSLKASKSGEWNAVDEEISEISQALGHYAESYGIDLRPRLKAAVAGRDAKETVKLFAQVIFLGMRDNMSAAMNAREDKNEAFNYLATAQSYYSKILSGNIKRKNPALHNEIVLLFEEAHLALGNPDQAEATKKASESIAQKVVSVYGYFSK